MEKIHKEKNSSSHERLSAASKNGPQCETESQKVIEIPWFDDINRVKRLNQCEPADDYLDKELIINGFTLYEGYYGFYVILNASVDGETRELKTASKAIYNQLKRINNYLPVFNFPFLVKPIEKTKKNGKRFVSLTGWSI